MWRDPMDELIADLETVVEATPPQFNDQTPSIVDIQHFIARDLRRADVWDGTDPDAVDPTYEEKFAECRARWPRFYMQGRLDRT